MWRIGGGIVGGRGVEDRWRDDVVWEGSVVQ